MQEHVRDVDQQYAALYSHLQHLTAKCHAAEAAQQRLLGENSMLRQMLVHSFRLVSDSCTLLVPSAAAAAAAACADSAILAEMKAAVSMIVGVHVRL